MEHEILIGGEESGGIGYGRFLPERDGILNALLLANVMAEEGKPLGQLVADLQREFGAHYYGRRDLHISDEMKNGAIRRAADPQTTKLGAYSVLRKEDRDGVKFYFDAPKARQRRRPVGIVSCLGHRTSAALLRRSGLARVGRRNSRSGRKIRAAGVTAATSGIFGGHIFALSGRSRQHDRIVTTAG